VRALAGQTSNIQETEMVACKSKSKPKKTAMILFDIATYPRKQRNGSCFNCGTPWSKCSASTSSRRKFRSITGVNFPSPSVSINLQQDFAVLGLDTTHTPPRCNLCLQCVVAYMQEFNRRNAKRREAEGPPHKQVLVEVGDMAAEVDEGLAPLIRELWRAGIHTTMSCQENRPGIAWIQFASAPDAEEFLSMVGEYEDGIDSLYSRINPRCLPLCPEHCAELEAKLWEYDVFAEDFGLEEDIDDDGNSVEEWHNGDTYFNLFVSIRFPVTDIPTLVERMVRQNDAPGAGATPG
jgi:hypothetical protein